jgi:hypothetical protein
MEVAGALVCGGRPFCSSPQKRLQHFALASHHPTLAFFGDHGYLFSFSANRMKLGLGGGSRAQVSLWLLLVIR